MTEKLEIFHLLWTVLIFVPVFQELLERAEWGADLPSVENNLQEHNTIHTAVEELMSSLQEARSYEVRTHAHTHKWLIHEQDIFLLRVVVYNEALLSSLSG